MAHFDIEQPREPNLRRNAGIGLVVVVLALAAWIVFACLVLA